jgi:fatty acid desaturase
MSASLLQDPLLRSVAWRDLTRLRWWETAAELTLSLPWLVLSLWLAARQWYAPAAAASFVFYLAGLRQVHNAFHFTLGLPRWASDAVMLALSVAMLGSMHAVRYNHMRHHRHCLAEDDVEAMSATMGAWRALVTGPLFPVRMHAAALRGAGRTQRRWIVGELAANVAWVGLVAFVLRVPALNYHVAAMALGQCLSSFFCVWTVHHGCDPSRTLARTLRHRLKSFVTFNMFFHEEHHLFPQVPTCRLATLADRLDAVAPGREHKPVF